jgi:hypothetical protein
MGDVQLNLTVAECDFLTELLQSTLKDLRIEEHRTRTPTFREQLLQREDVIKALLTKLGKPAA